MADDSNYRPNPARAVYIHGVIDENLVYSLTPKILELRAADFTPISVYIDSPGGQVDSARKIQGLLFTPDGSGLRCRILTIATGLAASAAADLLTFGDYALAYPQSQIYYHGTRLAETEVTLSKAMELTDLLEEEDHGFAGRMIESCEERFYFRCMATQETPDFEAWLKGTQSHLSDTAQDIVSEARRNMLRYQKTITRLPSHFNMEHRILRKLLNQELRQGQGVDRKRLVSAIADFFTLQFYWNATGALKARSTYSHWLKRWIDDYKKSEIDKKQDEELVEINRRCWEAAHEFLLFFVTLCRRLQQHENPLQAWDALHLGLIDEVVGNDTVPTLRRFVKFLSNDAAPGVSSET